MAPFRLLALLALAAPALSDLNCTKLIPSYGFNNTNKAYLQLAVDPYVENFSVPQLPANIQAGYPVTVASKNQPGTVLSLQTCESASLNVGLQFSSYPGNASCQANCSFYWFWGGARVINPATGHCLTVRSLDAPYTNPSDLYFKACDSNPQDKKTNQLFLIEQYLGLDENGKPQGDNSLRIQPPPSQNIFAKWGLETDSAKVQVEVSREHGTHIYATLLPPDCVELGIQSGTEATAATCFGWY